MTQPPADLICEACGETFPADAPGSYRDADGCDLCPGDAAHLREHAAMEPFDD